MPLELVALYASSQETLKNRESAAKAYEFIVSHDPQKFEEILYIWEQAADFFERSGDFHKALEVFEGLLAENPRKSQEIWLRCGLLYKKIGDLKSAVDAFKEILANNPKNAEARVLLSNIYIEEGDRKQALRVLEPNSRENQQEAVFFSEDDGFYWVLHISFEFFLQDAESVEEKSQVLSRKSKKIRKFQAKLEENCEKREIFAKEEPLIEEILKETAPNAGNFAEKIELFTRKIKENYNIDDLRLKFAQAEILLRENVETSRFIEKIFESLIISLKLEHEIQVFLRIFGNF